MTAALLDKRLYDAAQGKGGPWAIDVHRETGEPLRVRYDGDPRVGVASVFNPLDVEPTILSSGRRAKAAEASLKRARAEYVKAMADRQRWGTGT